MTPLGYVTSCRTLCHNHIWIPHSYYIYRRTTTFLVVRSHSTLGIKAPQEVITRRRITRTSSRGSRRSAFENLQVTDLRASSCVSRFAACFIGTQTKTSTAESAELRTCAQNGSIGVTREDTYNTEPMGGGSSTHSAGQSDCVRSFLPSVHAGANDPSAGSPTETLLRLLLPLENLVCKF